MAEALGVTASAVGVIGFAGQLAQSAAFCYNFFRDAKDAPKDVERLVVELQDFTILQGVAAIYSPQKSPDADIEKALGQCQHAIQTIEDALRTVRFPSSLKKGQRWWRQVKTALERPGLAKHIENLGRSKASLVQACMNNSRMAEATHFQVSQDMKARLITLAQDQADANNLAFETKTIVSGIEKRTAETHVSISRDSQAIAQMQPRVEAIERMTTELFEQRSTIDRANLVPTDPCQRERLVKDFADGISKTVVHEFRQYLEAKYMEGLSLANIHTSERPCQCNIQENQAAIRNTPVCSIRLPENRPDYCQQNHGLNAHFDKAKEQTWFRQSRSTSSRYLIRNNLLGTLKLQTTLTTYSQRDSTGSRDARAVRQIWHTKITYVPSFLGNQGIVAKYSPWKSIGGRQDFIPSFNIGLSTFNICSSDNEIFEACQQWDVGKVQDLFDRGLASPFDVDQNGRNLLGWTVTDLFKYKEESPHPKHDERALSYFEMIMDMLLSYGLDSSQLEGPNLSGASQNALSIYLYSLSAMDSETRRLAQGRLELVLEKILAKAKSDPIDNGNNKPVLLHADSKGQYVVLSYPTCHLHFLETMPKMAVDTFARQEDWPIPWSSMQVPLLCSLCLFRGRPDGPSLREWVREHLRFWVTSTYEEVKVHLEAKSTLLRNILGKQRIADERTWATNLLRCTMHDGAIAIAIFTRHDYNGQEPPWVRHRVKKLVLIRAFLVDTMEIIITTWWHELGISPIVDQLNQCAAGYNLRIVSIWKQALRRARRTPSQHPGSSESATRIPDDCSETGSSWETDGESSWETDQSDEYFSAEESASQSADDIEEVWETEDEWEEGPMLDKAVDKGRPDDKNTQIGDSDRHICCPGMYDFDEVYWSRAWEQIRLSVRGGPAAPQKQGIFESVAGAGLGYILGEL